MTEYIIDGEIVLRAIRNWDKIMNHGNNEHIRILLNKGPHRFSTFIGPHEIVAGHYTPMNSPTVSWGWKVSELAYNKIRMLASPHHYALLHAFKARTGWQGKIP